jgi:hypothetical protein
MDSEGDVVIYGSDNLAEDWPAGLDICSASVAPDLRVHPGATEGLPPELVDWGRDGELVLWMVLCKPIPDPPTVKIDWLFALDVDGNPATGRPPSSVYINPDLGDEAFIGVLYDPVSGRYEPYFQVWDPKQGTLVDRPEVPRFQLDERTRQVIGLALSLETLRQAVEEVTGSVLVPEDVMGRAGAVAYELLVIDVCPDLPQQ